MKRKKRGEKKLSRDYFSDVIEKAQITMRGKKALNIKEGGHVQMSILLP